MQAYTFLPDFLAKPFLHIGRFVKVRLGGFFARHAALLLILMLAFACRWPGLMLNAIDWDESNVLAISRLSLPDMFWFTFTHDFHPPGIHLTVALWTRLFGDTDWSLRLFALFWGLLAVYGAARLARQLAQSYAPLYASRIANLTALFIALMPLAIRYSHFATSVSIFLALFFFSWIFLLQLLDEPGGSTGFGSFSAPSIRRLWLYGLVTFWATQQYASGPFFMFFQGIYFLYRVGFRHWRQWLRSPLFLTALSVFLLSLPHIWVVLQPWHLSQSPEIKALHPVPGPGFFVFAPLAFLFYNVDLRTDGNDLSLFPPIGQLLAQAVILYPIWILAFRLLFNTSRPVFWAIGLMGPIPLSIIYALSLMGSGLFNYRSLLYVAFPLAFTLAFWLVRLARTKRLLAMSILVGVISMQVFLPAPLSAFSSIDWRVLGRALKMEMKPEDGLIVYPGFMALPLLRYASPADFGYSDQVLRADPTRGDRFFNQIDRIDDRYFMVSGYEAANRPWVKKAFVRFQARHAKLIFFLPGANLPPSWMSLLDCTRELRLLTPMGVKQIDCVPAPRP